MTFLLLGKAVQNAESAAGHGSTTRHSRHFKLRIKTKLYYLFLFLHVRPANKTTITGMALCHKKSLDARAVDLHIAKATTLVHSLGGNSWTYITSQL